jgi:hypothetical protein
MRKYNGFAALLLALCLLVTGAAAQGAQSATLQGLITALETDGFTMDDALLGTVEVRLDAQLTAYEGIAARDRMAVGQYVYVQYNGALTRSEPPQVTALKVSCFALTGTVGAILENGCIVEGDAVLGTTVVHMAEGLPPVFTGMSITAYYNGVLALSLPPQLTAVHLVVPVLEGTVSGAGAAGFTLTAADGTATAVMLGAGPALAPLPADGATVRVYYNGIAAADGAVTALGVQAATEDAAGARE